jgi:hypothetical protein
LLEFPNGFRRVEVLNVAVHSGSAGPVSGESTDAQR